MIHSQRRPVAISLRLYRALARAFPQEFRNAYGEELLQVTEDAIEPVWRRHGLPGLLRLLADVAVRVPVEHLAELRQDVAYGLRMLRRSPGFTAVAIVSLTLGIGVATAGFSNMNATILRDIPGVAQPGGLVALQAPTSYPHFKRYRELTGLFSSTFAYVAPVPFGVLLGGHTERAFGHLVTASYFSTLGVHPVLGRVLSEEDQQPGAEPAAVVSYRFWQGRLGSDPAIVGRTLRLNGHPCTVIGVGPKEFLGASPMIFVADLWLPVAAGERVAPELADNALERRDRTMFQVVGRLRPGVTALQAEAEMDTVARQLDQSYGEEDKTQKGRHVRLTTGGRLVPFREQDLEMFLALPAVLLCLILLIACANVANMMLARAASRRREIAVRLSLGASRARLVRQLLTESMLVSVSAALLGFILTMWLMHLFSLSPGAGFQVGVASGMPVNFNLEPDGRVLVFALCLAVLTGLAFGLVPALRATRTDLTPALKEGADIGVRRHRRLSLRNALMVCQVAASLALLLVTAFLVFGFQGTAGTEVGFDPRNLHLISLDPVRDGYSADQAAAFFQRVLERVNRLPSIRSASLTETVPMGVVRRGAVMFSAAGAATAGSRAIHNARRYVVGKDYFDTLGIPILHGRGFRKEDEAGGATAVIVSEQLVRQYWPGEEALGRRVEIIADQVARTSGKGRNVAHAYEIVGVARDAKVEFVIEPAKPAIYFPLHPADFGQPSIGGFTLMMRAAPGSDAVGAVRREVQAMDPDLTPFNARTMQEQIEPMLFVIRMGTAIYGFQGIFGLILAAVGLAGVTAYSVNHRRREIGIRIALGATSNDVLGLVMKEGMVLVIVGSIIGLVGARVLTRVLSAFMSSVWRTTSSSMYDPALLVGAPLLLGALALVACYLPARRSTRIDPVVALRCE